VLFLIAKKSLVIGNKPSSSSGGVSVTRDSEPEMVAGIGVGDGAAAAGGTVPATNAVAVGTTSGSSLDEHANSAKAITMDNTKSGFDIDLPQMSQFRTGTHTRLNLGPPYHSNLSIIEIDIQPVKFSLIFGREKMEA